MFFLLYRHTNDDFLQISDQFPKIYEDSSKLVRRSHERCTTFPKMSEDFRKLPKTFEEDPKMYNFKRDELDIVKSSISSLVRIWKICYSSPGCGFA